VGLVLEKNGSGGELTGSVKNLLCDPESVLSVLHSAEYLSIFDNRKVGPGLVNLDGLRFIHYVSLLVGPSEFVV